MTTPEQQWLEIYVRMVAGEQSEEPFQGVLEVREDEDSDDLTVYRVQKDRHRWRVETIDGQLVSVRNDEHVYSFGEDRDLPGRGRAFDPPLNEQDQLVARPDPRHRSWSHDDFSRPAEQPRDVTYLGRPSWEVTLLPPRHKEGALVRTVDASTGMLLEERNAVHGMLRRWLRIDRSDGFDDETFAWHGSYVFAGGVDEDHEELATHRARSAAARKHLGVDEIAVPSTLHLEGPELDEGGAIHGWYEADAHVQFAREREPSSDDLDEARLTWTTPGGWTWMLTGTDLSDAAMKVVRSVLEPRSIALDDL